MGNRQQKINSLLWGAGLLLLTCCKPAAKVQQHALTLLPAGLAWGALYQQQAAEYKGLCYQAYNLATLRLDEAVKAPSSLPKAIITDIDETVLDNSPYFVAQARAGKTYDDASWITWTAKRQCDTVPGAVQFLQHARALGVTVFYVTNRFPEEIQPTLDNLRQFNLPDVDAAHVFLAEGNSFNKDARRARVREHYEVLLLLGDNLGDFNAVFDGPAVADRIQQVNANRAQLGNRFILFPNAMYGKWEDILYKNRTGNKNVLLNGLLH